MNGVTNKAIILGGVVAHQPQDGPYSPNYRMASPRILQVNHFCFVCKEHTIHKKSFRQG